MKIYRTGDDGYEKARVGRVFNHKRPQRFPEAVFFPENENDVIDAVKFAKKNGHKIALRSGGHSWAVWSVRETGILIDLVQLNKIFLNEETGIVSAGPAVKGGAELVPYLKERGLFFNGGHCPTVGIGGFLLQGGQGWNARGWGWSAEYIESIDVVTADGELVHASETENTELFWAARGAGPGFFGIVTTFYLRTRPYPKALTASTQVYSSDKTKSVLHWLQNMHHNVKNTVEIVAVGQTFDFGEGIVVHALAFEDEYDEAKKALAPFEECPELKDAVIHKIAVPTTLEAECEVQLTNNPEGHRWVVNNAWIEGTPEEVSAAIETSFYNLPTTKTFTLWFSMAPLRPLPDMAFSMQSEIYMAMYTIWEDEMDDEKCNQWVTDQMRKIQSVTAGQYLGDSDLQVHERKFMSSEHYEKLEKIRSKYDSQGRFHSYLVKSNPNMNQNISD